MNKLEQLIADASPMPWLLDDGGDGELEIWSESDSLFVVATFDELLMDDPMEKANAALIVHSVNLFPKLLESLKFLQKHAVFPLGMIDENPWDKISGVIDQAENPQKSI